MKSLVDFLLQNTDLQFHKALKQILREFYTSTQTSKPGTEYSLRSVRLSAGINQHLSTLILTHTRFSSSCSDFMSSDFRKSGKDVRAHYLPISHADLKPMKNSPGLSANTADAQSMYMNMCRVNIWHLVIDLITVKNKPVQPGLGSDESDDTVLKLCLDRQQFIYPPSLL